MPGCARPVAVLLPVVTAALATLSSCTSGGTPVAVATKSAACIDVPADVLGHIASGARRGVQFRPDQGVAVMARPGVFVIAARFGGQGGAARVGVWTAPALTATSAPLLVADEAASAVTTWSSVEEFPSAGVPLTSPAIAAARRCLRS